MKTKLFLLLAAVMVSKAGTAQLAQKMMDNMYADASKIYDSNATTATLYGDYEKTKKVTKVDGTPSTFMAYFPLTSQSVSEASVPSPFMTSTFYRVRVYVYTGTASECLSTNFAYERQYDIDELFPAYVKSNTFIEEEIDADYLRSRLGDIMDDCGVSNAKAKLTLETQGKKGATVVISQAIFPIDDIKGAVNDRFVEQWTSGEAANTVDDEAFLSTIEKHLERNWGYDITTVNITYLKFDNARNFKFEGVFAATDDEGVCQAGDLFGTGGTSSNGSYYISAGNNTMGFSPIDCDVAARVANR